MSGRVPIALVILAAIPAGLIAQPDKPLPNTLIGEDKRARDELDVADQLIKEKRWDDAIRRYRQILTAAGDLFVPVDTRRPLPARWVVHQRLSQPVPAALNLYLVHTDPRAKPLLHRT